MAQLNLQYPNIGRVAGTTNLLKRQQLENQELERQAGFRNVLSDSGYYPGMPGADNILRNIGQQHGYGAEVIPILEKEQSIAAENQRQKIDLIKMTSESLLKASEAKTPEQMRLILDSNPYTAGAQIEWVGPDIKFTDKSGRVIEGPAGVIRSMWGLGVQNPRFMTVEGNVERLRQEAMANGVSITEPQAPKSFAEAILKEDAAGNTAEVNRLMSMDKERRAAGASRSVTNIDLGNKAVQALNEKLAPEIATARTDATSAISSLRTLDEAQTLLDEGMLTGKGAKLLSNVSNFVQSRLGLDMGDLANNSLAFAAMMGREVGQIIKMFGSGTGLSDADREYATMIAAGDIELTEESIRNLFDINRRLYLGKIRDYNKLYGEPITKNAPPGSLIVPMVIDEPKTKTASRRKAIEMAVIKKRGPDWKKKKSGNIHKFANGPDLPDGFVED